MDQKLLQHISSFKSAAEQAQRGSISDLVPLVDGISDLCKHLSLRRDVSFSMAVVFDREDGMFSALEALVSIRERSIQKAKEKCLLFVADFIKQLRERAFHYAPFIKEKSLQIFRKEESKSVQAAALLPVIALFELDIIKDDSIKFCLDWTAIEILLVEFRKAKTSGTLRSNILVTIGYTIEYSPKFFKEENVGILVNLCLDTLEDQLHHARKDPIYVLVAGALKCLDSLLTWFDDNLPAGGSVETAKRTYVYVEQVIRYREDMKRYEVTKAGLHLLSRHAKLFLLRLLENSMDILNSLEGYCTHSNAQLRDAALPAYDQYVSQLSSALMSDDHRIKQSHLIYKLLVEHMLGILDDKSSDPRLVSLAIRSLGRLSAPLLKYSGIESLKQAFQRLVPFATSLSRAADGHEDLGYSVTVVGAFADIVILLKDVDTLMISLIAEVTGNLFYQYPYLFTKQKHAVYSTVSNLFEALHSNADVFSFFLSNIVWSSLQRAMEPNEQDVAGVSLPLWKHYVELWDHLIEITSKFQSNGDIGGKIEERPVPTASLHILIFDSIIRGVMKALIELNLKYRVRAPVDQDVSLPSHFQEETDAVAMELEVEASLIEPLSLADMRKFLNMVDFVQEILSSRHAYLVLKWTYPFGRQIIELSSHYPLISGFYKILRVIIVAVDHVGYFKKTQAGDHKLQSSPPDISESGQVQGTLSISHCGMDNLTVFQHYLREVVVTSRRYKYELLASCLQLCLSAPPRLLNISTLLTPLKQALKMGLRYYPLATAAIDTLERWHKDCPLELQHHFSEIVPQLNDYLFELETTFYGEGADLKVSDSTSTRTATMSISRAQLARIRAARVKEEEPGSFELLQIRVQKLLGRIGRYAHFLVPDVNLLQINGTGGLAWDTIEHVKFTLPFRDEKLDLYLDPLLPRIVELSLTSSDRRTKVTACELLHAMCLLILGNSAKGPLHRTTSKNVDVNYDKLYKKLFPAILRLATDVELVIQQLFHTFVKQLIHWLTSNTQKENAETMVLLDAILDCLVDDESGSIRELSADCFAEFMLWSIRHTPLEVNYFANVTSMLRRLYNRMDHPNPYHRLGAAMAVQRIYPVLRENVSITDKHILEMLYFCIKSLRIGETDPDQIGTFKQLCKALEGLKRLVKRNIDALQRERKDRLMFSNLQGFLEWLFYQTKELQEKARKKCMDLLCSICQTLQVGSLAQWFVQSFGNSQGVQDVVDLVKVSLNYSSNSQQVSIKQGIVEMFSIILCPIHWMEWAIQQNLVAFQDITCRRDNSINMIARAISIALETLAAGCDSVALSSSLTPNERDLYQSLRRSTFNHIISLFREIMKVEYGINEIDFISQTSRAIKLKTESLLGRLFLVIGSEFERILCIVILRPHQFGYTVFGSQQSDELGKIVSFTRLLLHLSTEFRQGLVRSLNDVLHKTDSKYDVRNLSSLFSVDIPSEDRDLEGVMGLLKGYQQLNFLGILMEVLGKEQGRDIGEKLMEMLLEIKGEFPPVLEPIVFEIFHLAMILGVEFEKILEYVLDKPSTEDVCNKMVKGASSFYLNFRKVIVQHVKFSYKKCLPLVMRRAVHNCTSRLLLSAILEDYLCSQGDTITRGSFMEELIIHFPILGPCCTIDASFSDKLFALEMLQKILKLDSKLVLNRNHSSFKFIVNLYLFFLSRIQVVQDGSPTHVSQESQVWALKTNALSLLPFFLKSKVQEDMQNQLVQVLTVLITDHLLVREADLPAASMEKSNYTQMLSALLGAVVSSNNIDMLDVLFPLLQNSPKFVTKQIFKALESFGENIGENRFSAFNFCLDIITDSSKVPGVKNAIIDHLFTSLVNTSSSEFVVAWYVDHIKTVADLLEGRSYLNQMDAEKEQDLLVVRINHYTVLELLFSKVEPYLIKEKITPIVSNQLLMKLTTNESRAKNDPIPYSFPNNASLWRGLHIAAYKCLAAIVVCTQDQPKIYTILFKDYTGNPLWQNLIDCSVSYHHFPVETPQLSAAYNTVKSIRAERRIQSKKGPIGTFSSQYMVGATMTQEPSVITTFIGKDNLADSSFIGTLDGAIPLVYGDAEDPNNFGPRNVLRADYQDEKSFGTILIDEDDLDQHPCMGVVLKLIEHLSLKFGNAHQPAENVPEWVQSLQLTLGNVVTPVNVRLFLAKVVTKASKVFAPFSSIFFRPLVLTIIDNPETSGGHTFHYLLRDVCISILQWNMHPPPDDAVASSLVSHLMAVASHESRQVLKANVEIIKTFLEVWQDHLLFDKGIICGYLQYGGSNIISPDKKVTMQRSIGLQLLGAMIVSGMPFHSAMKNLNLSKEEIYKLLLLNLKYKVKEVFQASAELLGIALKERKEGNMDNDGNVLEKPLRQFLMSLFRDNEFDRLLYSLDRLTYRFPSFLENYTSLVVELLPSLHGVFLSIALDILLRYPISLVNLQNMVIPSLSKLLPHRDEIAQLKCLKLLIEIVNDLSNQKINDSVMPVICEVFGSHQAETCRQHFFQLLMYLYETNAMKENKLLVDHLLMGLSDKSIGVRQSVQQFWHSQLPQTLTPRLSQILSQMHAAFLEGYWSQYTNVLLLKLCENSVDYKRPIFYAPLSECEFHEQKINSSLLSGSLPMTPLFAETQTLFHVTQQDAVQHGSTESFSLKSETIGPWEAGKLRATIPSDSSLTLSQTQGATAIGTLQDYEISALSSGESAQGTQVESQHQLSTLIDPVTKLKRRFYHPKAVRSQTIRGVINANKRKEAILSQQASERLSKVQMMRQYRIGELPDIEIKHEDLIGPLASLAEKDKPFANLLLRLICRGIYRTPEFWQHEVGNNLRTEIRKGFEKSFSQTNNDISFIGCIQSICLEDQNIWIKPKDIGSSSLTSSNLHTGILLLENQILHETKPGTQSNSIAKRHKGQSGLVTNAPEDFQEAWLELAQLYKALGEDDYVLSIYLKNLTSRTITHEALEGQIRGDTNRALVLYEKTIDDSITTSDQAGVNSPCEGTHFSKVEEEIWYTQRLACLVNLNQWGDIMEDTLVQIQNEESTGYDFEKLWHPRVENPYLGLFIKGSVKVAAYHQMLTEFLQASLEAPNKREKLLSNYSTEVATLALANDDIDRARHHVLECYRYFRKRWTALHPLATGRRHLQIKNLQKSAELDEFISLLSRFDYTELKRSLHEWRLRWPSAELDDVEAWDDILQNRLTFFHKIQSVVNQQAEKGSVVDQFHLSEMLDVERAFFFHEAAKGVMKLGAYDVAQNYMNEYLALNRGRADKDYFDQTFFKRLVKLRCLQAERTKAVDLGEAAKILQQVLDYVQATSVKPGIQKYRDRHNLLKILEGNVSSKLAWAKLEHSMESTKDSLSSLESCISLLGASYKLYIDVLADLMNEDGITQKMANASFKFACFCDEILKSEHDSRWGNKFRKSIQGGHPSSGLPDMSAYPKHIVTSLMQAMSLDSSLHTQHAVARILSFLGKYPETVDIFVNFLDKVPSWIFLPWIPQMLALLESNEGVVFASLLETISKSYPQALYYAFHVSKSNFGPKALERTQILSSILRNPMLEMFVRSLEDLTFPEKRLLDGLSQVKQCLSEGKPKLAEETFCGLFKNCLDAQEMGQSNRRAGDYNVKFANDYSNRLVKALGENGSKLLQMDDKAFENATNEICANLRKALAILPTGKLSLGSFSKWMADFNQAKYANENSLQRDNDRGGTLHHYSSCSMGEMEIPGQYDGYQKPDPSHHVKIVGFDQILIGLSSKQRPKILTIRGSDEKDHKFVVKGGEDLRLDQRIQQLFSLMDSILHKDAACAKRRLSMRTYAVVPVSKQCGLLQFVENTSVLEDVIKDGLSFQLSMLSSNTRRRENKDTPGGLLTDLRCQYQDWVLSRGGSKHLAEGYRNMYTKAPSKEIVQKMTAMEAQIPWDALKMGIFRLATSAESYLVMRLQFARSLSVLSICGYIAGVGDRHLANTLVDLQSGSLVSIDFGYSFGTGIILLPVPELIPFRLTPHLTNVLLPMDALGILRNDMVHTMSALRFGRHLISAVMEVFVREPLVDWKQEAIKTANLQQVNLEKKKGGARLEENFMDLEKQHVELKVENAHRKLELWNPAEVTIGELQSSVHANKPYMQALESMVRGFPEHNVRSRVAGNICKSVQEQVDCLIDQATDRNLLGRLWVGWQPWI